MKEHKDRLEDIKTARDLLSDDLEEEKRKLQEQYILQNTAKLNVERATEQRNESESVYAGLQNESREIEQELLELSEQKEQIAKEIADTKERETQIDRKAKRSRKRLTSSPGRKMRHRKSCLGFRWRKHPLSRRQNLSA